jgi:hypothetical protein
MLENRIIMNATNQNVLRLGRIQKASRFLKKIIWIYVWLVTSAMIFGTWVLFKPTPGNKYSLLDKQYASWSEVPLSICLLGAVAIILTVFGLIAFYRLLSLYEKGVIFSPANAAQFHYLGLVAIGSGVVQICLNILTIGGLNLFELITSPWIYGGLFLLIVGWIMEEGSKIQEEQDLTV